MARMRVLMCCFMLVISFFALPVIAGQKPLPAAKAFKVAVKVDHAKQVTVQWEIAEGYYLYHKHLHFTLTPPVTAEVHLPKSETRQDLTHGEFQVYSGQFAVPIIFTSLTQDPELKIEYQGCSEKGFCYPPMHKTVKLAMLSAPVPPAAVQAPVQEKGLQHLLTDQNGVYRLFESQSAGFLLLMFAGLGLLLALTPCVLPMIPILMSIIAGHQHMTTRKALMLSVVYVLGSALTYAGAGLLTAYMGASLQMYLQQPWVLALASGLFVLLALSLFGLFELRLPGYWQNRLTVLSRQQTGGTYVGVFIMGVVSTLIVSPCVTAPLVGVLAYIAKTGDLLWGASALFVMGIGMGIPLVIMAVSAGKWLPKRGPWMVLVQYFFGGVMLLMAFWLLSRVFSLATFMIFVGALLLSLALLLRRRSWFNRGMSLASGLCGILLIASTHFSFVTTSGSVPQSDNAVSQSFTVVKNLDDLNQQLVKARLSNKPVLLDFYADWCESCIVMDKKVFTQPDIMQSLSSFVLLRVDLTENNEADEIILKNFDVIAPPTVIFFNTNGEEVTTQRIVGELNADEFHQRVQTFITALLATRG